MFRGGPALFDRLLEKATSNLLLEPDWAANIQITDMIRGAEVPPRYAVVAIKKKFYHDNPHVVLYALQVMEACVKNCGSLVHNEVATKQFMEELRELVKRSSDESIRSKVLEMIQNWGMAFRNSPKYRIVTDTLNLMKAEGWEFPPVREAEAMFEADVAPEWAEGEVCHRCRTAFGLVTRQHHCRACGQVFCGKCSAKTCVLPKFGIEKEVRVCDACFDEYGPKDSRTSSPMATQKNTKADGSLPDEYIKSSLAQQAQAPKKKSEEEIKEEEELQLAIALSQSEAEHQQQSRTKKITSYQDTTQISQPAVTSPRPDEKEEEISPELMRYLNRSYWEQKEKEKAEQKNNTISTTAPPINPVKSENQSVGTTTATNTQKVENIYSSISSPAKASSDAMTIGKSDEELDEFVTTLKTQIEIFVNRMKSNSSRGRSIANDSSVQTLFMNMMAMHSQLLKHIQDQEDKRVHFEGLQDKLTQVKDARAALDALREEERERKRREQEEAERLRQIQMQEKLEVMRQRKQEYLQYQRQLALQRMQETEREMMMRQEQAKRQYMMQTPRPASSMPMQQPPPPPQQQHQQQFYNQPVMPGAPMPGGMPYGMPYGQPMQSSDPAMPSMQQHPSYSMMPPMSSTQQSPYSMQSMMSALPPQMSQVGGYPTSQPMMHVPHQQPDPQQLGVVPNQDNQTEENKNANAELISFD